MNYGKLKVKLDELVDYENIVFSKMGYIEYYMMKELKKEVGNSLLEKVFFE